MIDDPARARVNLHVTLRDGVERLHAVLNRALATTRSGVCPRGEIINYPSDIRERLRL